ncbi:hypothetical protein N7530_001872 [Penicillium desertorum]|uniref:Uncharacterized protein n=1 Tax=Penicillium desertorum TaxID=1303715 RepID=A0A9W9XAY7_9EURO|nr:hypothetical protein N7530_001872 [Penicillium desertorum]
MPAHTAIVSRYGTTKVPPLPETIGYRNLNITPQTINNFKGIGSRLAGCPHCATTTQSHELYSKKRKATQKVIIASRKERKASFAVPESFTGRNTVIDSYVSWATENPPTVFRRVPETWEEWQDAPDIDSGEELFDTIDLGHFLEKILTLKFNARESWKEFADRPVWGWQEISNTLALMIIPNAGSGKFPSSLSLCSTQGPSTRPSSVVSSVVEGSIAPKRKSASETANPKDDGWFISDFYAFNYLFRGLGMEQTWLTAVEPTKLVNKYGPSCTEIPMRSGRYASAKSSWIVTSSRL